jgi:hypothetical protein
LAARWILKQVQDDGRGGVGAVIATAWSRLALTCLEALIDADGRD